MSTKPWSAAIIAGLIISFVISSIFFSFVLTTEFGRLLDPAISDSDYVALSKLMLRDGVIFGALLAALAGGLAITIRTFARSVLGSWLSIALVALVSMFVAYLIIATFIQTEFKFGHTFRVGTVPEYADVSKMFGFTAFVTVLLTFIMMIFVWPIGKLLHAVFGWSRKLAPPSR